MGMITAVHCLIYSDEPEATRAFLRDVLDWPFVQDAGSEPIQPVGQPGPVWLIRMGCPGSGHILSEHPRSAAR